jgi:hypothetical protein
MTLTIRKLRAEWMLFFPDHSKSVDEIKRFFELALVLVRFDHVASRIVNANHSTMVAAVKFRVVDCITGCVWLGIPQRAVGVILIAYFAPGAANF